MFDTIKSLFSKKSESRYENDFNLAIKRTRKLGLGKYPNFKNSNERLISDENIKKFCELIKFYDVPYQVLSNKCLPIHLRILDDFNSFFGVNGVITIGHVIRKDGKEIFY